MYSVECGCGEKYIGETGRTMNLRMKEHQRAVKYDNTLNGISVHANTTRHAIAWETNKVLHKEKDWNKRKVLEALYIREEQTSMNLDNGLKLHPTWGTIT